MNKNKTFTWKLKDILMVAIIGVLFSFLYLGTDYAGLAISTALTPVGWGTVGYEPLYGIYFMAASLAMYIIQKPGVGIVAELIAATLEVLMGNWFGPGVILTGILQGAAVELAFFLTKYRKFNQKTMILGSVSVALISYAYHFWESQYYLLAPKFVIVMALTRLVSSIIFTGIIATLLGNGLAKAGVLKAYPLGQRAEESYEVDE